MGSGSVPLSMQSHKWDPEPYHDQITGIRFHFMIHVNLMTEIQIHFHDSYQSHEWDMVLFHDPCNLMSEIRILFHDSYQSHEWDTDPYHDTCNLISGIRNLVMIQVNLNNGIMFLFMIHVNCIRKIRIKKNICKSRA